MELDTTATEVETTKDGGNTMTRATLSPKSQWVLARLYTDTCFREQFLADPVSTGGGLDLSTAEIAWLREISAGQITSFAHSLWSKRLGEVKKLLPLTHRLLGGRFGSLFRQFASRFSPRGPKPAAQDASEFARFLKQTLGPESSAPPWTAELARFEAARAEAASMGRWLRFIRLRYPVHRLTRAQIDPSREHRLERRLCLLIWVRSALRGGRPRRFSFSAPRFG